MDASEHVKLYAEFLSKRYYADVLEQVRKGEKFLIVDFAELLKFNVELADQLLEQPEQSLKAGQLALEQYDENAKGFTVRYKNLPSTARCVIRDIRSKHLNKFLLLEGVVKQKSEVRPQVTIASFECPSCGNRITVPQIDTKFKEPYRCTCGRKGKFLLLGKQLVDAQGIVLEEIPEQLDGGAQPKRLNVFLQNDLVSPISDKRTNPGAKIRVSGVVTEIPIITKQGVQSTRFDLIFEANNVEPVEEDFSEITISEEQMKEIKELSMDPKLEERMIRSIAPNIYGHDTIKEALVLQLLGGVRKTADFGPATRGDIHVLLIGDPGAGKCIVGDSFITLHTGEILSIREFVDRYEKELNLSLPEVFSLGMEGNSFVSQPLGVWKRKSPKSLLKIKTSTGHEVLLTKDHPLFTTEHGLIYARPAQDFKIGDYIATPSKMIVGGVLQTLPVIVPSRAHNRTHCGHPTILDGCMARLLGYLTGDGSVRKTKTGGCLAFSNSDVVLLQDFERLVQTLFQKQVSKRQKVGTSAKDYYVSSVELSQFIHDIEPTLLQTSGEKRVSVSLMKSPNHILKEYIKALYDCEGHVVKTKREIEFSTKSEVLAKQLRLLLLRFGIYSQLSSMQKYASNTILKTKRTYYRLRISGAQVKLFFQEIGFTSPEKRDALERIVNSGSSYNTNINIVPHMKTILSSLRKAHNFSQFSFPISRSTYQHYECGDRNPSREHLKMIADFYNTIDSKDPLVRILSQASSSDIFWDKIVEIKDVSSSEEYVYDLEIEMVHNFVANGVMVHNSQLLKRISKVAPKARFISGKGVSGAGITAAVVKDEFLGGWSLEAGALVLSNKGVCCIDELDKMSKDDTAAMHEALEGQTITISKANVQATLRAETTVLAAANPKFGRFDNYAPIAGQIALPPTLINRFDLIFPIKDIPDKDRDEKTASFILSLHQKSSAKETADIETQLLRRYIAYARQKCRPVLTDGAIEEIQKYYLAMRGSGSAGNVKNVPITARQLEALVRLSEAAAKLRLSEKVQKKDAKTATRLVDYYLRQVAFDETTGKIDIDKLATGIPASQRSKIMIIKELIAELENKFKPVPLEEVMNSAEEKGVSKSEAEEIIQKLRRMGDIFEPKRGFISRI